MELRCRILAWKASRLQLYSKSVPVTEGDSGSGASESPGDAATAMDRYLSDQLSATSLEEHNKRMEELAKRSRSTGSSGNSRERQRLRPLPVGKVSHTGDQDVGGNLVDIAPIFRDTETSEYFPGTFLEEPVPFDAAFEILQENAGRGKPVHDVHWPPRNETR